MVKSSCSLFKKGSDEHHIALFCQLRIKLRYFTRNFHGQIKERHIFGLTEIKGVVKFLKNHQFSTLCCQSSHFRCQTIAVVFNIGVIVLLYNSYIHKFKVFLGNCIVTQCSDPCCLIKALQSIPTTSCSGKATSIILKAKSSAKG